MPCQLLPHQGDALGVIGKASCPVTCFLITGLTSEAALESLKNHGLNQLSSAPVTPEWQNFIKHFFDGFYILLWAESFICFAG